MSSSNTTYKYATYILIVVALATLYIAGIWDTDLGDYTRQINQLSATGSLINDDQLNNRYPPVTSLVYFTAFQLFSFAGRGFAILLLHTAFALLIQRGFDLLLLYYGYRRTTLLKSLLAAVVVFNPFTLSFIVRGVNSELIFMCCSLYAVWFAVRTKGKHYTNLLIAGILTGIAILTRMQGLALALSLCLLLFLHHRKLIQPAAFLLAAALTITPWQYLNSKHGNGFISSGGLPSFRDGLSFNNKKYRQPIALPQSVSVLSDSFYHIYYTLKEGQHIQPAQDEVSFVKNYLADNPGTAFELAWLKIKRSFYGTDSQSPKVELLNQVFIGIILLVFAASAVIVLRQHNQHFHALLTWILTYSALTVGMSVMVLSILRYQAPLLPFLFLPCFIAFEKLPARSRSKAHPRLSTKSVCLILIFSTMSFAAIAQTGEPKLFHDEATTNDWLAEHNIPAVGIGYIEDGKIKELTVYGKNKNGQPHPQDMIFNVASLTKPVTAMVALKLVNSGQWHLDEPLYKYWTDPDIAQDPRSRQLTTRHILSHKTGFPNWRHKAADGKLAFEYDPGTKYQYSGEGFEYLRKALEAKFKKPLEQLAAELLFLPLGMKDTRFYWDETVDEARVAHWFKKDGGEYPMYKNRSANAADDLLTAVEDYSKFALHIMNGAGLSKELFDEMIASQAVTAKQRQHFGLGWVVDENVNGDEHAIIHGGDDIGVHTIVIILPVSKKGLVIFTNADHGTDVYIPAVKHYLGSIGDEIIAIETK